MNYLQIEKVTGREIMDSRGNPTVEAEVKLACGVTGRGMAPRGLRQVNLKRWSFGMVIRAGIMEKEFFVP